MTSQKIRSRRVQEKIHIADGLRPEKHFEAKKRELRGECLFFILFFFFTILCSLTARGAWTTTSGIVKEETK